jgi:drug/metabolite transporter (DMT)-like permease
VGIRFLLAFLVLAVCSRKNLQQIQMNTVKDGCLLGLFLFIGYVFQTVGLQFTSSSNCAFITGLSVVLVPVIYSFMNRKLPHLPTNLTVLMAAIGLFLLSVQGASFKLAYGDLVVLICAFGFALHIVFVDRVSHKHNPVAISAVQILFVGLLCIMIGLLTEPIPKSFSFNTLMAIVITSVLATALAFLLQNALQKYSTPTSFAVVLTGEPVFAAITGYFFAGEILSQRGIIGALFILGAMLISILVPKTDKAA